MQQEIDAQQEQFDHTKAKKMLLKKKLNFLFAKRRAQGIEKRVFYTWRQSYLTVKFIGDRGAYVARKMRERKVRKLFESWRGVTHVLFRERI